MPPSVASVGRNFCPRAARHLPSKRNVTLQIERKVSVARHVSSLTVECNRNASLWTFTFRNEGGRCADSHGTLAVARRNLFGEAIGRIGTKTAVSSMKKESPKGESHMMDVLFLIVAIAFFAGAIAYVEGCERL